MPALTANKNVASGDGFDFGSDGQVYTIDSGVTLSVDDGDGVGSSFKADEVANFGVISAPANLLDAAVRLSGGTFNVIFNAADASLLGFDGVVSTDTEDQVINDGAITGILAGVSEAQNATIDNSGQIFGQSYGVKAEHGSTIHNSGTISSDGIALDLTTASGSGNKISVVNFGLIRGEGSAAISCTGAGDLVATNEGHIDGNVQLGNGTNTFDSRHGGTVTGTITGGSGADTIYLGNDGETVNGGLGHDVIFGGTGADTFVFTSDGAANADGIRNFNVGNDIIELSHATFTKLAVGSTPVFSIGTAATSASDHLYYNSTGGGLWYDPDGSGPQAAVAIANLGAGLKLTASNFTVV